MGALGVDDLEVLEHRDRTERAQRALRGEEFVPETQPLPKVFSLEYGDPYDSRARLVCPLCGSKALEPLGVASDEDALVAFFACEHEDAFGVEFASRDGEVVVRIYVPSVSSST